MMKTLAWTLALCVSAAPSAKAPSFSPPAQMQAEISFLMAAVGEEAWTPCRDARHWGDYRVVGSAFARKSSGIEVRVDWQVRPAAKVNMRIWRTPTPSLRVATGQSWSALEATASRPRLAAGVVSPVVSSHYRLPPQSDLEGIFWGFEADAQVVRVRLAPRQVSQAELGTATAAPQPLRCKDAGTSSAPTLSLLQVGENGVGCVWLRQMVGEAAIKLATSQLDCAKVVLSIHPDGTHALMSGRPSMEVDLKTGVAQPVMPPAHTESAWFVAYTQAGQKALWRGFSGTGRQADAPQRLEWGGGGWNSPPQAPKGRNQKVVRSSQMDPPWQELGCQILHAPVAYPFMLTHDDCNLPEINPMFPAPVGDAEAVEHLGFVEHWVCLGTPQACLVAQRGPPEARGSRSLRQPVYRMQRGVLLPLEGLGRGHNGLAVALRGPFALLRAQGLDRSRSRPGRPVTTVHYELFDLRTGASLAKPHPSTFSASFWPEPQR